LTLTVSTFILTRDPMQRSSYHNL